MFNEMAGALGLNPNTCGTIPFNMVNQSVAYALEVRPCFVCSFLCIICSTSRPSRYSTPLFLFSCFRDETVVFLRKLLALLVLMYSTGHVFRTGYCFEERGESRNGFVVDRLATRCE